MMHLAQFLVHGPTYHSLAMWRHPRTAAAGDDWASPELYQHIARVCERAKFDMVFFADLNYVSDTYGGSMGPALGNAPPAPPHDPTSALSFMAGGARALRRVDGAALAQRHPSARARSHSAPVLHGGGDRARRAGRNLFGQPPASLP